MHVLKIAESFLQLEIKILTMFMKINFMKATYEF